MTQPRKLLLAALVFYGIVVGVLPYALHEFFGLQTDPRKTQGAVFYPWNFSPLHAIALFTAATMTDWRKAIFIPIAMRVGTDLGIFLVTGDRSLALYDYQAIVYGGMLLFVVLGVLLRREHSPLSLRGASGGGERSLRIGGAALSGEVLFFLISNFGSWLMYDTYPHTASGLMACYIACIPSFGRSLIGTIVYSGALFGGSAWLENRGRAGEHAIVPQRVD